MVSRVTAPTIEPARLRGWLRAFARIGYGPSGGMHRLAFSRGEWRAHQLFIHLLGRLGARTRIDPAGNVFARLPGAEDEDAPPVLLGSHLDTVPDGGRFDGAAGVCAALEVAATLRGAGVATARPLELACFAAEESSRFGRGTIGSGLLAGAWEPAETLALRDAAGVRLDQALRRRGLDPARVGEARRPPGAFGAYLELHIEQGRVLEAAGDRLGIVVAIAAPTRLRLCLEGRADHSGATPMELRRDALAGASEVVLAVERAARAAPGVVATVGTLRLEPGAINVVPGLAELSIDVRSADFTAKARVVALLRAEIAALAAARGLIARLDTLSDEQPVTLDSGLADLLERRGRARGLPQRRIVSGAGHDAMQLAKICPAGMLFVPSRDGISHNRAEWTDPDDIAAGAQVLLDAALELVSIGRSGRRAEDREPEPNATMRGRK